MSVVRSLKVICLIVPLVWVADCGGSYGDFLDDPDNAGVAQWATPMKTAPDQCVFDAVAVDKQGNSYAVGYVSGSGPVDFGGNSIKFEGNSKDNAVIVKYDALGVAQWALSVEESSGFSYFNGIAVDDSGNAYAVGSTCGLGWYDFGGESGRFYCNMNLFHTVIVKYDTNGAVQWATPVVDGKSNCVFSGIAVDKDGNSYAVGYVAGHEEFTFGGACGPILYDHTGVDTIAVIVKYNSAGTAQWARTVVVASNKCEFSGVAVDEDGNAYAVGKVIDGGSFSFVEGGAGLSGKFDGDDDDGRDDDGDGRDDDDAVHAVIVKYNTDGIAQWENTVVSASGQTMFNKVAADREGNAYAVGYVDKNGSFNFGGRSDPFYDKGAALYKNAVIVKYGASGIAQWAVPIEFSEGPSEFKSVTVDILGNVYASGSAHRSGSGLFDFGGNSQPFSFAADIYEGVIVKYTSEGIPQWATTVKSDKGESAFYGIAVDRLGYTYVAGFADNSKQYYFGGKSTPIYGAGNGDNSSVIVKYY